MIIGVDARPLSMSNMGGIGHYVFAIVEHLKEMDGENEYILYSHKPIVHTGKPAGNFIYKTIPSKVGFLWIRYRLPHILKKDRVDLFWGTQHSLPRCIGDVRDILTVHDIALLMNPRWGTASNAVVQNVFLPRSLRNADEIISVSESTKRDIVKCFDIPDERIHVTYSAGNIEPLRSNRESASARETGARYFFYIGDFGGRKNIAGILNSYEILHRCHQDVRLVLAGSGRFEDLQRIGISAEAMEGIDFLGYITSREKVELLRGAEALVFPSYYEGFGVPVVEAQSQGCLVITARNSSLPEVGGEAALYLENADDHVGLANLMEEVLSMSEDEKERRRRAGLEHSKTFSWKRCAKETLDIFLDNANFSGRSVVEEKRIEDCRNNEGVQKPENERFRV